MAPRHFHLEVEMIKDDREDDGLPRAVRFTAEYLELVGIVDPARYPDGSLNEDRMVNDVLVAIANSIDGDTSILVQSLIGVTLHEDGGVVTFTARFEVSDYEGEHDEQNKEETEP